MISSPATTYERLESSPQVFMQAPLTTTSKTNYSKQRATNATPTTHHQPPTTQHACWLLPCAFSVEHTLQQEQRKAGNGHSHPSYSLPATGYGMRPATSNQASSTPPGRSMFTKKSRRPLLPHTDEKKTLDGISRRKKKTVTSSV